MIKAFTVKKDKIIYNSDTINVSRDELIEAVKEVLSEKRFKHVLRVEEAAIELAEHYHVSTEKVSIAALLHDYCKEENDVDMRELIIAENFPLTYLKYGSAIWHGPIGAHIAENEFDVTDPEILAAIANHTVGANEMSDIEKIVMLADQIEEGRYFPGIDDLRKAARKDLDTATLLAMKMSILHLIDKGRAIFPQTIYTYNALLAHTEEK